VDAAVDLSQWLRRSAFCVAFMNKGHGFHRKALGPLKWTLQSTAEEMLRIHQYTQKEKEKEKTSQAVKKHSNN
jgi:hypothetical protein